MAKWIAWYFLESEICPSNTSYSSTELKYVNDQIITLLNFVSYEVIFNFKIFDFKIQNRISNKINSINTIKLMFAIYFTFIVYKIIVFRILFD